MGTRVRVIIPITLIYCYIVIGTKGQLTGEVNIEELFGKSSLKEDKGHHGPQYPKPKCNCDDACMTGPDCRQSLESYSPRFNQRFYFTEVTPARVGQPLQYNSTTYPGGNTCPPCQYFEYTLKEVIDEMDRPRENDDIFQIERLTGKILTRGMSQYEMYKLTVQVRNVLNNDTDETKVTVASKHVEAMDQYFPLLQEGYSEGYHHRSKRALPADAQFVMTQITPGNLTQVGQRLIFEVTITFPAGTTDMNVEIFSPDNETAVMILCDVIVKSVGTNLGTVPQTVIMDSKSNNVTKPDMAKINFGSVTNNGADTTDLTKSQIVIRFSAVTVENAATLDNKDYYISVGAEYLSGTFIWIGFVTVRFITDNDMNVPNEPTFNVTLPSGMAVGSVHMISVDLYLPYPTRDYIFRVSAPLDTVGVMSMCAVWFVSAGDNFQCGNDFSLVTDTVQSDPQGPGYMVAILNLGTLLNKGSRDTVYVEADSRITVNMLVQMLPWAASDVTETIGFSLEVDDAFIWVGSESINVLPEVTTGLTPPILTSQVNNLPTAWNATVGKPFTITYTIQVPDAVTTEVASHYVLELLAPFSDTPVFTICSFKVISVGRDIPCLNTEDLVTEYSTREVDGLYTDKAVIDIGFIIKNPRFLAAGDDLITVEAILIARESHPIYASTTQHTVTLGLTVGVQYVSIGTANVTVIETPVYTPATNTTSPNMYMQLYNSDENVALGADTMVWINMTTSRSTVYPQLGMEFLVPTDNIQSYFHICRVEIFKNGKNTPCFTPEWAEQNVESFSKHGDSTIDRATMTFGDICNSGEVDDINEDMMTTALYLKVKNISEGVDMERWVSAGMNFGQNMWLGQLKIVTPLTPTAPTSGQSYSLLSSNTTVYPLPNGYAGIWSHLFKASNGSTKNLEIKVETTDSSIDVCNIRIYAAGWNYPCVADHLGTRTYQYWPSGGRSRVTLNMGWVTNYGYGPFTGNDFFDQDSIESAVFLRAKPGTTTGSYPFSVNVAGTTTLSSIQVSSTASVPFSNLGDISSSVLVGDDSDQNIAIGEARPIVLSMVLPEGSVYNLTISMIIPAADRGKIEIADALVSYVGAHFPCIDMTTDPIITSSDYTFKDTATFNFFINSHALWPGDTKANTINITAWVLVLPNGQAAVADTVQTTVTLSDSSGSISAGSMSLTVTDPSLFVDKIDPNVDMSLQSLISLNNSNDIFMEVGQTMTLQATLTVPPCSSSKALFDVEMPTNESACLTVSDVRVIGAVGRNVIVTPSANTKGVLYTPEFNDTTSTGQSSYAVLDLGIIENTCTSQHIGNYVDGDDNMLIEFDIQMADCVSAVNGSVHVISVGDKMANYVSIYNHNVVVTRDADDRPDINITVTVNPGSTSTVTIIDAILSHSNVSQNEGRNMTARIYFPYYQTAPTSVTTNSTKPYTLNVDAANLVLRFDDFFFSDGFEFQAEFGVNNSIILPAGMSSADSAAVFEVGMHFKNISNTPSDWLPYWCSDPNVIEYNVIAGLGTGCDGPLGLQTGQILPCQIARSVEDLPDSSVDFSVASNYWKPFVRSGKLSWNRYLVVAFRDVTKVSAIDVTQLATGALVTEIEVSYSDDGTSWFGHETLVVGNPPTIFENIAVTTKQEARAIRVRPVNDTLNGVKAEYNLRLELYGCVVGPGNPADVCAATSDITSVSSITNVDFASRSFVVGAFNQVFVCDRDPNSLEYKGVCLTSTDGNRWTDLDKKLASMIGYEFIQSRVYALGQDNETVYLTNDNGKTWGPVDPIFLTEDRLLVTWTPAVRLPETADSVVDTPLPLSFTQDQWGATYTGMYLNGASVLFWSS